MKGAQLAAIAQTASVGCSCKIQALRNGDGNNQPLSSSFPLSSTRFQARPAVSKTRNWLNLAWHLIGGPLEGDKEQSSDTVIATITADLERNSQSRRQRIFQAVALAALGSIPWVGGMLSAAATFRFTGADVKQDDLRTQWLMEHEKILGDLRATLNSLFARLKSLGSEIEDRLESPEYLALVRKAFREWDQADTNQKRELIVKLITHAAGTRICSDDVLRLFLDWIEQYHEAHFAVIGEIYKNPGPTRYDIWLAVYGEPVPRDDSADADLYRMLIRDLSLGGVIRQPRETDAQGRFRKKTMPPRRLSRSATMESAFEDTKQYVLTELGSQFVHYTMTELITRVGPGEPEAGPANQT